MVEAARATPQAAIIVATTRNGMDHSEGNAFTD
jgi:hypothetical protein